MAHLFITVGDNFVAFLLDFAYPTIAVIKSPLADNDQRLMADELLLFYFSGAQQVCVRFQFMNPGNSI